MDANNIQHQEDGDYSCVSILGKRDYDITYNTNPNYLKGVGYYVTYVAPNGSEGTPIFAKTFELLLDILYRKGIIKSKTSTASAERKFRFSDGSIVTANSKEEAKAQHKVMAAKTTPNICVYVDLGWSDVFPDRAQDIVDKMDKKVAYYDPASERIACKDEKTANLIKQKVFKALEGDEDAQKHLKIGKEYTHLYLSSKELEKWVNKTYKGLLSYTEDDSGICLIPKFPLDALKKDEEEDDCDVLISVDVDDELGQSNVYKLKGFIKGSLVNLTYDPIHEDFSFEGIKKLIDDNLIKLKELISNYKNKQLKIINNECTPILTKISSFVK